VRALAALRGSAQLPPRLPNEDAAAKEDGAPPAIPRGTLRVVWRHNTCDEMRRLALPPAVEADLRRHHVKQSGSDNSAGLLVCDQVVRGGTGEQHGLEVGDILVTLETFQKGIIDFPDFDEVEAALDAAVSTVAGRTGASAAGTCALVVRRGGDVLRFDGVGVEDLHNLNPRALVEFGGGIVDWPRRRFADLGFDWHWEDVIGTGSAWISTGIWTTMIRCTRFRTTRLATATYAWLPASTSPPRASSWTPRACPRTP
jgi:hypothetical protein